MNPLKWWVTKQSLLQSRWWKSMDVPTLSVPLCWIVVWRLRSPDCAGRFEGRAGFYLQVVSKLYIII